MGIKGLLPAISDTFQRKHLRDFTQKTAAIDAYSWLHKGCFTCSVELARGEPTDRFVAYFMKRINLLLQFQIVPYVVFDGGYLPSKAGTEKERHLSREKNRKKGEAYMAKGDRKRAMQCFSKAVDISPEMAYQVIVELRKRKIRYVVAPYEADAQMAYLCKVGLADFVISEDSDCIPYDCPWVLFKLDHAGFGMEYKKRELVGCHLNFANWTHSMIIDMCILSGCDYLKNLKNVGITRSHRIVGKYKKTDRSLRSLHFDGTLFVPQGYEDSFRRAKLTFRHHRVFDPRARKEVHLNPLPDDLEETSTYEFLGPPIPENIAREIADGVIDPITRNPFDVSTGAVRSTDDSSTVVEAVRATNSSYGIAVRSERSANWHTQRRRDDVARAVFKRRKTNHRNASITQFFVRNSEATRSQFVTPLSKFSAANDERPKVRVERDEQKKEQLCPNQETKTLNVDMVSTTSTTRRTSKYFGESNSLSSISSVEDDHENSTRSPVPGAKRRGSMVVERALAGVAKAARALGSSHVSKKFRTCFGNSPKTIAPAQALKQFSFGSIGRADEAEEAISTQGEIDASEKSPSKDLRDSSDCVRVVPETPEKLLKNVPRRSTGVSRGGSTFRISKFAFSTSPS